MQCPKCGTVAPEGSRFCELDGTPLIPEGGVSATIVVTERCRCGAGIESRDSEGFCMVCGRRWESTTRDHLEVSLAANFGGVTDKGKRHPRNEDDMALVLEEIDGSPVSILIVCDGVSSSEAASEASAVAAVSVRDSLLKAVRERNPDLNAPLTEAIGKANDAVLAIPYVKGGAKDPPETTIVAAIVRNGVATIGWVGDSRAYWIGQNEASLLTHDHSWINDVVDAGQMSEAEALRAPNAHAINRCLGGEAGVDPTGAAPSLVTFTLPGAGRLLLCTDGLWNYASTPEEIAALVRQSPADVDALALSRTLTTFALEKGGRDNITAVVASF